MSKDDHDKFVLFLIVVGFIVLVVCGLAWQGAGIFNLPFTVMLWTIIRLIIVVSLVFITENSVYQESLLSPQQQ